MVGPYDAPFGQDSTLRRAYMMSDSNASSVLTRDDRDGVCILTMNRPDAMNSMNGALVEALHDTFLELRTDSSVRVVVLTGAGPKAFCAGADLTERRTMSDSAVQRRIFDYARAFRLIEELNKPVIAAINGYAFGGGLEIALACDLRIVASETKIGLTETRLGIIPGAGGTQRLPRVVGEALAKELIFTARRLTGDEALDLGLVSRSVPREQLLDTALELAREIAKAAPIALEQAKIAIHSGMQADLATGLEIEARCYQATIPTKDRLEGLAAFKEKRAPEWKGE